MYVDVDLFSLRKNGRLAAVWLAATNKTLFRRYFKRGQCEKINIDEMCKSILDCANANKPLVMVAKLAYGAVFIYQQQVQILFDKVSSAAFHQAAALRDIRNPSSMKDQKLSVKYADCDKIMLEEHYEECLNDRILSSEEIIRQLLAGKRNTNVTCSNDITIQEPTLGSLYSSVENTFSEHEGFGEMRLRDYNDFLGISSVDSSQNGSRLDSGIVEDTTGWGDSIVSNLSHIVDNIIRGNQDAEAGLKRPSIDIIEMPIVSTNVLQLKSIENDGEFSDLMDTLKTTSSKRMNQFNAPNSMAMQTDAANENNQRCCIIDQRTKLDSNQMKRAIEDCYANQRCKNPRSDIVPEWRIRYPSDTATKILKQPVRNVFSSFLSSLFTRNARKRTVDIQDILPQQWDDVIEIKKQKVSHKSLAAFGTSFPFISLNNTAESAISNPTANHNKAIPFPPTSQNTTTVEPLNTSEISQMNKSTESGILEIHEFSETLVTDFLSRTCIQNKCPVPMKRAEKYFSDKLAAATFFSSILGLIAKKIVRVSKNEKNEIVDIQLQQ